MDPMSSLKNTRGFTLIEIMAVVAIIGLLLGLVAVGVNQQIQKSRKTTAEAQIRNFEQALELYYMDNGFYPSTEQGLEALITQPSSHPVPKNWRKGYLRKKEVPQDPWGYDYIFISPGARNEDSFDLASYGADNREGGDGNNADITNWATTSQP